MSKLHNRRVRSQANRKYILVDTVCLVGVSVESKSDKPWELDVERLGVGGVDMVEIRSNSVDHLQMHPFVDGDLQQQEMG